MRAVSGSVSEDDTVLDAARKLRDVHMEALPVARRDGQLEGVLP
ncbi:CBS domain-containing protein [Nonomuraea turcica]